MAITADDLVLLREWVPWSPPTDAEVSARFDTLGSWQSVALGYTRRRLSEMLANPSSFSVGGEYSESWTGNISALSANVKLLEGMIPMDESAPGAGFSSAQLVRPGRSRGRDPLT